MTDEMANKVANHIERLQKLNNMMFEALSVIAVGNQISPQLIAQEALTSYVEINTKASS